jgi:hypothetical protein
MVVPTVFNARPEPALCQRHDLLCNASKQQARQSSVPAAAERDQVGLPSVRTGEDLLRRLADKDISRDVARTLCRCPVSDSGESPAHRCNGHSRRGFLNVLHPRIGLHARIRPGDLVANGQQHQFRVVSRCQIGSEVHCPKRWFGQVDGHHDASHASLP